MELPLKYLKEIEACFDKNNIHQEKRKGILLRIKKIYNNSLYDPKEAVGVVTAQSLSEPATQMTMRTYHFAGTAGIQVTLGLPRMLEIFDARKEPKTPTMTVHIQPEYQSLEKVREIAEAIREVKVKDMAVSTVLDMADMVIRCRINLPKLGRMGVEPSKLQKMLKLRNSSVTVSGDEMVIKPRKKNIGSLHKLKYSLLETHIRGIKGISQVVVTKEEGEWVINTLGSNLKKVFSVPGVDTTRTTTNNIFEIQDVLGIEAARNALINQTQYTMEEQGLGVDIRYVMLLADLMTSSGDIRAIGRYGISGQKASVLVRASFEETKKHLVAASIKGENDPLTGIIENIMLNQVAPVGTGTFNLVGSIPKMAKPSRKKSK